jgi:hypothetical protein
MKREKPQQVKRIGVLRMNGQKLAITSFRFRQPARLMMREARRQQIGHARRAILRRMRTSKAPSSNAATP